MPLQKMTDQSLPTSLHQPSEPSRGRNGIKCFVQGALVDVIGFRKVKQAGAAQKTAPRPRHGQLAIGWVKPHRTSDAFYQAQMRLLKNSVLLLCGTQHSLVDQRLLAGGTWKCAVFANSSTGSNLR